MTLPRQKFREIVFLLLYSYDFFQSEEGDSTAMLMQELKISKKYLLQAHALRRTVESVRDSLDLCIQRAAISYEFERIPRVERNILRLCTYELLYPPQLPGKVAISEAIRLSRKFSSPESAAFVNAVLDAIYQKTTSTAI